MPDKMAQKHCYQGYSAPSLNPEAVGRRIKVMVPCCSGMIKNKLFHLTYPTAPCKLFMFKRVTTEGAFTFHYVPSDRLVFRLIPGKV